MSTYKARTAGTKTNITHTNLVQAIGNYEWLTHSMSHVPMSMVILMNTENKRATMSQANVGEVYDPELSKQTGRSTIPGLRRIGKVRVMVPMHRICLYYRLKGDDVRTTPERVGFMTVLARDWDRW